jgi:ferredoxin-thioredoxin reductase catalytic chain
MTDDVAPTNKQVDELADQLNADAQNSGYRLNSDAEFTHDLARGLLANKARYGYASCPCRLASGDKTDDLDIICPCDYRDADLNEYGSCYCALYVSQEIAEGKRQAEPILERRPPKDQRDTAKQTGKPATSELAYPVWRCSVCGYLCARDEPPQTCPICKASKERFQRFM